MYLFLYATLNFWLPIGGLALLAATVVLAYDYHQNESRLYTAYLHPFVWPVLLLTTAGSVALTLVYSEYFGFIPCSLCWLQRIALYPQALFAALAYRTKEDVFFPLYSIALALFCLAVAIYQYIYQMVPQELRDGGLVPCLADGTADCATKIIDAYGFVTFPLLSAITFAFLIVVYLNLRRHAARVATQ